MRKRPPELVRRPPTLNYLKICALYGLFDYAFQESVNEEGIQLFVGVTVYDVAPEEHADIALANGIGGDELTIFGPLYLRDSVVGAALSYHHGDSARVGEFDKEIQLFGKHLLILFGPQGHLFIRQIGERA